MCVRVYTGPDGRRLVGMHLPQTAVTDLLAELHAQEQAAQQAQRDQQLHQVHTPCNQV